ncbi:MAG TPA: hypothetical protein VIY48_06785, partial [Candidatus Paceibacterota bacterium]
FSARMANGDTTRYCIQGGTEWEVGVGTWNTGGTLTRTTVLKSSNSDSAVNFSAGTKDVFMTIDAAYATRGVVVGSFAAPGSTGNHAVTGVGFKPRKVRFVVGLSTGTNNLYNEGVMDDAGNQWAWASAGRAGAGTQSVAPSTTRCLLQYDLSAGGVFTKEQEAHYVSMDSDGFTINFDTSTSAGPTVLYVAER